MDQKTKLIIEQKTGKSIPRGVWMDWQRDYVSDEMNGTLRNHLDVMTSLSRGEKGENKGKVVYPAETIAALTAELGSVEDQRAQEEVEHQARKAERKQAMLEKRAGGKFQHNYFPGILMSAILGDDSVVEADVVRHNKGTPVNGCISFKSSTTIQGTFDIHLMGRVDDEKGRKWVKKMILGAFIDVSKVEAGKEYPFQATSVESWVDMSEEEIENDIPESKKEPKKEK